LVIEFGAFAEATVVVDYRGNASVLENVEIVVGDGAKVTVVSLQNWEAGAIQLSAHAIKLGRDASIKHVVVNLGGAIVRLSPTVQFAGPGGQAECFGVSFAGTDQHFESRLFIDHSVPECTSNVLYKNALLGTTSRTVWIGDVRIRPAATGTQTYEMNRNLLLSDGARADSVPNLEIETGEIISAGHASATGRFDDLQLFYLQSRGIDSEQAERLVVRGFFADVVERIGIAALEASIMTAIEARLGFAPQTELEN
jgi:Fe-S cluster assembly protein SufD